jgi:hypothetical protein
LRELIDRGEFSLIKTHVELDELRATPDTDKRAALLELYDCLHGTHVAASAMIWDVSDWDEAEWTATHGAIVGISRVKLSDIHDGIGEEIAVEDIMRGNPKFAADALLAVTADTHVDALVTNDIPLTKRIGSTNTDLDVWDFETLVATLEPASNDRVE